MASVDQLWSSLGPTFAEPTTAVNCQRKYFACTTTYKYGRSESQKPWLSTVHPLSATNHQLDVRSGQLHAAKPARWSAPFPHSHAHGVSTVLSLIDRKPALRDQTDVAAGVFVQWWWSWWCTNTCRIISGRNTPTTGLVPEQFHACRIYILVCVWMSESQSLHPRPQGDIWFRYRII